MVGAVSSFPGWNSTFRRPTELFFVFDRPIYERYSSYWLSAYCFQNGLSAALRNRAALISENLEIVSLSITLPSALSGDSSSW